MIKNLLICILVLYSQFVFAEKFSQDANYKVCFTPAESCTNMIVSSIDNAQRQILVQAYSFTSRPIAKALIKAHERGVKVTVIVDKSQFKNNGFSSAKMFSDYHIPVLVDYLPNIAHNKVMIIDSKTVITGSFNFTKAAEEKNTENVLIISDRELAKKYMNNWQERAQVSKKITNAIPLFVE